MSSSSTFKKSGSIAKEADEAEKEISELESVIADVERVDFSVSINALLCEKRAKSGSPFMDPVDSACSNVELFHEKDVITHDVSRGEE